MNPRRKQYNRGARRLLELQVFGALSGLILLIVAFATFVGLYLTQ
jgi:hypothetical protein